MVPMGANVICKYQTSDGSQRLDYVAGLVVSKLTFFSNSAGSNADL